MRLFDELLMLTGLSSMELRQIISNAPKRYKSYSIPKRSGGVRIIAQPSKEIKFLQRYLARTVLAGCRIHPAATAYTEGSSIRNNAGRSSRKSRYSQTRLSKFFPSDFTCDWRYYAGKNLEVDLEEVRMCSQILFWGKGTPNPKCLSIGAPTSPLISNLVMYEIDQRLSDFAHSASVKYTRYADDITISGQNIETLLGMEKFLVDELRVRKNPRMLLNNEKRGLYTRKDRRSVTGLILTPTGGISLGRKRKRMISYFNSPIFLGRTRSRRDWSIEGILGVCECQSSPHS